MKLVQSGVAGVWKRRQHMLTHQCDPFRRRRTPQWGVETPLVAGAYARMAAVAIRTWPQERNQFAPKIRAASQVLLFQASAWSPCSRLVKHTEERSCKENVKIETQVTVRVSLLQTGRQLFMGAWCYEALRLITVLRPLQTRMIASHL